MRLMCALSIRAILSLGSIGATSLPLQPNQCVGYLLNRRDGVRQKNMGAESTMSPLNEVELYSLSDSEELLSIHEIVDQLATEDRQSADLVKLRYFAGLSMDEAAAALGISIRKAHYTWAFARSWLRRQLGES